MFPDLKNKKFIDISTNETVKVVDQFENIAILDSNRGRIDVKKLLDRNFYDEYVDPKDFFSQQNYQVFTEKIKSIPTEDIQNMKDDDSPIITEYDPEEEKRILQEKANQMFNNSGNAAQSQIEKFKEYLDEEDIALIPQSAPSQNPQVKVVESVSEPVYRHTDPERRETASHFAPTPEDPMITMFKNIKKNTSFKVNLIIENKIPRPDFIEMMEDSYEVSIIEYLSNEFTKNLLDNPNIIKDMVSEEIKKIVYGDKKKTDTIKAQNQKRTHVKKDEKKVSSKPIPPVSQVIKEGQEPNPEIIVDENKITS